MEFQIIKNSELLEVILMPDDDSNLTNEQVEELENKLKKYYNEEILSYKINFKEKIIFESVSDLAEIEPETLSFVEIYLK